VTEPLKKRLLAWIDLEGEDFLGSGLSFNDFMLSRKVERWKNSISCINNAKEERRRIKLIRRLVVAAAEIEREYGCFNQFQIDQAILAIINGDWVECQRIVGYLEYGDESAQLRDAWAPRHAPLRALIIEARELAIPVDVDPDAKH